MRGDRASERHTDTQTKKETKTDKERDKERQRSGKDQQQFKMQKQNQFKQKQQSKTRQHNVQQQSYARLPSNLTYRLHPLPPPPPPHRCPPTPFQLIVSPCEICSSTGRAERTRTKPTSVFPSDGQMKTNEVNTPEGQRKVQVQWVG